MMFRPNEESFSRIWDPHVVVYIWPPQTCVSGYWAHREWHCYMWCFVDVGVALLEEVCHCEGRL